MKKPRVYVSGVLTGGESVEELKRLYERIGAVCAKIGCDVYIPHQHTDPVLHSEISPQEVYHTDMREVSRSDLVIAYVGLPSLGVGAEIERAHHSNIDVVILYEEGARVSRLIRGSPAVLCEIPFSSQEKALQELEEMLSRWFASRATG